MTKRLHASPLTLLFFRIGIAPAAVPILAFSLCAQIEANGSVVTNATDIQIINDVPHVTQNPLFYAMLQNGVQPRNETSTSTFRRSINDRQSVSAS